MLTSPAPLAVRLNTLTMDKDEINVPITLSGFFLGTNTDHGNKKGTGPQPDPRTQRVTAAHNTLTAATRNVRTDRQVLFDGRELGVVPQIGFEGDRDKTIVGKHLAVAVFAARSSWSRQSPGKEEPEAALRDVTCLSLHDHLLASRSALLFLNLFVGFELCDLRALSLTAFGRSQKYIIIAYACMLIHYLSLL